MTDTKRTENEDLLRNSKGQSFWIHSIIITKNRYSSRPSPLEKYSVHLKMSPQLSYSPRTKLSLVSEITVNRLKENTTQTKQFSKEPTDVLQDILLVAFMFLELKFLKCIFGVVCVPQVQRLEHNRQRLFFPSTMRVPGSIRPSGCVEGSFRPAKPSLQSVTFTYNKETNYCLFSSTLRLYNLPRLLKGTIDKISI